MESKNLSATLVPTGKEQFSLRKGWRAGILRGIVLVSLVFIVNLTCTIYALSKTSRDIDHGQKVVFEGACNKVKHLEVYLHLVINILSTIILGASNYAMQCLSAPTRQEVKRAHRQGIWLDIGVLSLRNLRMINSKRVWLWTLLGLSSVPLHLFYNSVIYASTYSADYTVFMTTENYLLSNSTSHTLGIDTTMTTSSRPDQISFNDLWQGPASSDNYSIAHTSSTLYTSAVTKTLIRRNTSECIDFYATNFPTNQGNLILVSNNVTNTPRIYGYSCIRPLSDFVNNCVPDPADWICHEIPRDGGCNHKYPCLVERTQLDPSDWRPLGDKIDYCLSEDLDEKCILTLNLPVIIIVLIFSILKFGLLVLTLWVVNEKPLMTLGDAIASFLRKEDSTTRGMCLMDRNDLGAWKRRCLLQAKPSSPKTANTSRRRWNSVVGNARWVCLLSLYIIMLGICISLFLRGILSPITPASTLMKLPLGDIDPMTFIQGWGVPSSGVTGLLSNIFVANSPQLLLSMIYFTYNSLFTTFSLGAEWNSFMSHRKGLRVSEYPTGNQRSTHFLQLPFRWAIPLMTLSATLHWLCSQSIFLVSIEFFHRNDVLRDDDGSTIFDCSATPPNMRDTEDCLSQYFTCGYSPVAILSTISLGIAMIGFAVLTGLKRYDNGSIPIVGSCSAAISASCHMLDGGESVQEDGIGQRAAGSRLQWGEFDMRLIPVNAVDAAQDESEKHADASMIVYHCGLSHHEVSVPDEDKLYA